MQLNTTALPDSKARSKVGPETHFQICFSGVAHGDDHPVSGCLSRCLFGRSPFGHSPPGSLAFCSHDCPHLVSRLRMFYRGPKLEAVLGTLLRTPPFAPFRSFTRSSTLFYPIFSPGRGGRATLERTATLVRTLSPHDRPYRCTSKRFFSASLHFPDVSA